MQVNLLGNVDSFDKSTNFVKKVGSWDVRGVGTSVNILEQFNAMKLLSFLVNKIIGHCLPFFVGAFGIFLSGNLDKIFLAGGTKGSQHVSKMARWLFINLRHIFILVLSADICRQERKISNKLFMFFKTLF